MDSTDPLIFETPYAGADEFGVSFNPDLELGTPPDEEIPERPSSGLQGPHCLCHDQYGIGGATAVPQHSL